MTNFEPRYVNLRVLGMVVLVGCVLGSLVSLISGTAFILFFGASVGLGFYCLVRLMLAIEADAYHTEETLSRLIRHHDQLIDGINALNESILLSEEAKSIAFRKKDLQALRQAVEEETANKDWEAALYLADQMEKKFGARQQAESLRQKVTETRDKEYADRLAMAMAKLDDAMIAFEWESAESQISQIQQEFPDGAGVVELPEKLETAKVVRKKWLLKQYDQAVQSNEIDRGVAILKELDQYLTPSEAAAFEESARGVFKAKLHNLGVQFSLLVAEKVWDRALAVAEEIVGEFPNTRMAQEITQGLVNLRAKAQGMKTGGK